MWHKTSQWNAILYLIATILFFSLSLKSASAAENSPSSQTQLNEGEKIYLSYCAVCHGDQGNGKTWVSGTLNPPPRNFTDPGVIQFLNRDRMRNSITNGRPGTGMQPWKSRLSSFQIESVIDYIRETFMG